jgi:hypothetical protein
VLIDGNHLSSTQVRLADTYKNFTTNDRREVEAKAIFCCEQALRFYTPVADPAFCRATNQLLDDIYFTREQ